jgi:Predicted sugar phosphatases of the HAD superfamily
MASQNDIASLRKIRGLVIDMDGVLWQADQAMPGLNEFFDVLRERGIKFVLATNNNTMPPEGFVKKAAGMGVELSVEHIMTASLATVAYLRAKYPTGSRVYIIGEAPLKNMITSAGFEFADHDVVAVVAAMDRQLTYEMLKRGSILIRGGAEFVGVNPDACYPTAEGLAPGSGPIIAALALASGVQPNIMGKPEKYIFTTCMERMGLTPEETASLGDRLDTDIEGGLRTGMRAILVLSGVTTAEQAARDPIQPTWIFNGIKELAEALR